jgi:flagellar assembly protein FliH
VVVILSKSDKNTDQFKAWVLPRIEDGEFLSDSNLSPPTVTDLEQWGSDAREEGFQQGFDQGFAQGKVAVETQQKQWGELINALDHPLKMLNETIADTVFNLSITIAQQLVKKTLQVDPDEVISVVTDCLEILAEDSEKLKISLNPTDATLVIDYLNSYTSNNNYQIVEDAAITQGGCIVQSKVSTLDATLEKRFATQFEYLMEHKDDEPTGEQSGFAE